MRLSHYKGEPGLLPTWFHQQNVPESWRRRRSDWADWQVLGKIGAVGPAYVASWALSDRCLLAPLSELERAPGYGSVGSFPSF